MAAVAMNHPEPSALHVPSTVSVIICAHELALWEEIVAAVTALETQSRLPDQVVLVIDHHDELLRRAADGMAERTTSLRVDVVANTLTVGRAGARNAGIAWADGEIIAFLDAGSRLDNTYWVATLLEDYADPDVAGVGGGVVPGWDDLDVPTWMPPEFTWAFGCSQNEPADVADVDGLAGGNMSFRREVFDALGGFRAGVGRIGARPVGGDDIDYCLRVRDRFAPARLVRDPDLEVAQAAAPQCSAFVDFRTRCWDVGVTRALADRRAARGRHLGPMPATTAVPAAVVRGVVDGVRGRPGGFRRAGAAAVGLGCAAAGYARGRLARRVAL